MFDEQPDGDIHGECAHEIRRLERELAEARKDAAENESILCEANQFMTLLLLRQDAFSGHTTTSAGPVHDRIRARLAAIDAARLPAEPLA